LHVLNGDDVWDLDGAENDEQGELTANKCIAKIYKQFFLDIIKEALNWKSVQDGSYLSIHTHMCNKLARPELLQTVDLLFTTAQYSICTDKQWTLHFDCFFPKTVENDSKRQNFGRYTYYINYVAFACAIMKPSLARAWHVLRN
jgi:hypothetical protein